MLFQNIAVFISHMPFMAKVIGLKMFLRPKVDSIKILYFRAILFGGLIGICITSFI